MNTPTARVLAQLAAELGVLDEPIDLDGRDPWCDCDWCSHIRQVRQALREIRKALVETQAAVQQWSCDLISCTTVLRTPTEEH